MNNLIASFLFQNKACPLPGVGSLYISIKPAESDFVNKVLTAPVPVINFTEEEMDSDGLVQFISTKTNSSNGEVREALQTYCTNFKIQTSSTINGVGTFTSNSLGTIQFQPQEAVNIFTQAVKAERVIHPEATHNMLVGDKETTSTIMTEYYSEESPKKDRWWIWAIVFAVISIATIILYFNDAARSHFLGNAVSYKLAR